MVKFMTYKGAGVDYEKVDIFKQNIQLASIETEGNIRRFGMEVISKSRGDTAFLIDIGDRILAHVVETLGTKNLVSDAMLELGDRTYWDWLAQCTLATFFNDVIPSGALPISAGMHLAVCKATWFENEQRCQDLINGWIHGCNLAGAVSGCGETPILSEIIEPGAAQISGSAIGHITPKNLLIDSASIRHGDIIIVFASSGLHANGYTLARAIGKKLAQGYATKVVDGLSYGEALLAPTTIYVQLMETLQKAGINIHYAVNMTGHGWRKLMRAIEPFVYVIDKLPPSPPIFDFIMEYGPVTIEEALATLNMGGGFAAYVDPKDEEKVIKSAEECGIKAWNCGHIEKRGEEKRVIFDTIEGLEFKGDSLKVR